MNLQTNFFKAVAPAAMLVASWMPSAAVANDLGNVYVPSMPNVEQGVVLPRLVKDDKGIFRFKDGSGEYHGSADSLAKGISEENRTIAISVLVDKDREDIAARFASGAAKWLEGHPRVGKEVAIAFRIRDPSSKPNGEVYRVYVSGFPYSDEVFAPNGFMRANELSKAVKDIVISYRAAEELQDEDRARAATKGYAAMDRELN